MKFDTRAFLLAGACLAGAIVATAQDNVTVIPRPQVNDGSNASRAPFPTDRTFSDVTPPDGEAIDESLPPNTEATEPAPPPPPTVAIFQSEQPAPDSGLGASEPTLAMTGRPTTGVSASLEATRIAAAIRSQPETGREQLFTDVESRLKSGASSLQALRNSTRNVGAAAREQFDDAADDLRDKEKALRKSLKAARKAKADNWESAREQLAADYEAYAAAAARVDSAAGISANYQ